MSRICSCGLLILVFLVAVPQSAAQPPAARPIEVRLDATEAPRKLLRCELVIPAEPGPLTLYYPKWIPGEHAPNGPINDLSGLKLRASGKPLQWRRDEIDLHAFHCTVPEGADAVEASLEYLAPSGASMTAKLATVNWYLVTLYPKGPSVYQQQVHASIKIPQGWKLGTALPIDWQKNHQTQFKVASLVTFIDSPVLCGAHFREIPIGPKEGPPHFLTIACDSASGLEISDELKSQYDRLITEAGQLFGARHYRSYRFLVAASDHVGQGAVEHHESSDNHVQERFFVDKEFRKSAGAWVLPHEYVHSWNGKYRRAADMIADDFQKPQKTRELWVYEGLTEYLGYVLTGRSSLYAPEHMQQLFGSIADWAGLQGGRTWRPLIDTTVAAPFLYHARQDWASRRRGVDFYDEGALLWLDADTLIREKTKGSKSLDDFCRAFFGGKSGVSEVKPYSFGDIVRTLNEVVEHDWKTFLEERLHSTSPQPPLDGLKRSGWKLAYRDEPTELMRAGDSTAKTITLVSSVGLQLNENGQVVDVIPGSAADKAGIGPGMKLVAVNERRWTADRLKQAVAETSKRQPKLSLLLENQDYLRTYVLNYSEGARYPHLERDEGRPDLFSEIFGSRKSAR
jgi:predicted metalloprotease with PDZ domain